MEETLRNMTPNPAPPTSPKPDGRVLILKFFFLAFLLIIVGRLVQTHFIDAGKFRSLARKQYEQTFVLPAVRGSIFDRNGHVLVSNTVYVSLAADPKMIGNKGSQIAERFSRSFGKPRSYYLERLRASHESGAKKRFVWLERRVLPERGRKIEKARFDGIVVINEPKRLYHYDELAGPLLGLTDIDNNGIGGLELQYNDLLKGTPGFITMQRDGLGKARPSADYPKKYPVDGYDVVLTIDLSYQAIAEEELQKSVLAYKAEGGLVLMLNPKTGEVLASAIYPSMNPNKISSNDLSASRNRIATDVFEPGSLFKLITSAAAYEHRLIPPDRRYNAEKGKYRVPLGGRSFRLISDTKEHQTLTFQQAFEVSSNIVMAKASEVIGPEKLYRQARDFGFGIPTGIEIPGEVRGRLKKPHEWSKTTLHSLSFGYEVSATPLQIAAAYAAAANKGVLMKPIIVSEIRSSSGEVVLKNQPQKIRRVVSDETSIALVQAMEGVVERGSGKEVKTQSVRIAGKTGTSRRIVDGKYVPDSYTASFAGFFPVEDPQVLCLVMLDNPKAQGYYGGVTAGAVFRKIAERVVQTSSRFSLPTSVLTAHSNDVLTVPDVRNLQPAIAVRMLETTGFRYELFGSGEIVIRQSPDPGTRLERGDLVRLSLNHGAESSSRAMTTVPDLRGMSIRRAINRLVVDDFDIRVQGSGVVMQQIPEPHSSVSIGSLVTLVCEPRSTLTANIY